MARGKRLGLIGLAIAIAAAAFAIIRPQDDDNGPQPSRDRTAEPPSTPAERPTATIESRTEERIELRDHAPTGSVRRIEVSKGDLVRITIESDAPDRVHLHGYDIERKVAPRAPARFSLRADIEGVFDLESHVAEEEGRNPAIARLVVEPS